MSHKDNSSIEEYSHFWQQGLFASFTGCKGVRINYATFSQPENLKHLIICAGRSEGYLKYQELAYDFYKQGYNIYLIDHRGQGISQRLLSDKHKGYVESFDDYVDDLHIFVSDIVNNCINNRKENEKTKPYLLAHSMGGAIATLYMQRYPDSIKAAVLSSPMMAINSGVLPNFLAELLVKSVYKLNLLCSSSPWYFIGQKAYSSTEFSKNVLTHCQQRYQDFNQLYNENVELQLGGVTPRWLVEALIAKINIFAQLAQLKTPLMVLQAGNDVVVDNQVQIEFCRALNQMNPAVCPQQQPFIIKGAYHELLFEIDEYRDQAIAQTIAWFDKH